MAPKKKTSKKSARSPKKKESSLATLLKLSSDEELDAIEETLDRINFNSRILEVNQQAEALQADLRQLLQDHPDKAQGIAEECYHLAHRFINALNELSVEALGAFAEKNAEWPMMVGRATRDRRSVSQAQFLKQIRLGKQCSKQPNVDLTPKSLYPADLAFLLASTVRSFYAERFNDSKSGVRLARLREAKWKALPILAKKINGTLDWRPEHIARLKRSLDQLKPLGRETLAVWIDACLAVFICVTKDQFENPKHPFKSWTNSANDGDKNKRGVITDRLRDALSSAFGMPRIRKSTRFSGGS